MSNAAFRITIVSAVVFFDLAVRFGFLTMENSNG